MAGELATQELQARGLEIERPLVLTDVELLRGKPAVEGDPDRRGALVTHYRYEGNVGILTTIDLESGTVESIEEIPDMATRLTQAELDQAAELALADPTVQGELGPAVETVVVEGLMLRTSSPEDDLYGQRAVRLLFREGTTYLGSTIVIVNLTSLELLFENPTIPMNPDAGEVASTTTPSSPAPDVQSPTTVAIASATVKDGEQKP